MVTAFEKHLQICILSVKQRPTKLIGISCGNSVFHSREGGNPAFMVWIPAFANFVDEITNRKPYLDTGRVYIPANDVSDVSEGGQPAAEAEGVTYLDQNGIYALFSVDSGEYRFSSSSVPPAN